MASGDRDPDAKDALSKLLQMGMVAENHNEFEILTNRVTEIYESLLKSFFISGLKLTLQIELLRARPTTLGETFSLARIIEARFEDESNQAVNNNIVDEEDPNVNDKQEVKKADDQEIKNVKDEEGRNVEDQQVSEANDDTNNDDVGYMRQPIKDEAWFLAHEINYLNDNEKKSNHRNSKSTQENGTEKNEDDDQSFAEED
ncbi:hypothetical protein Tco_0324841 [Tanacetum coccineum]